MTTLERLKKNLAKDCFAEYKDDSKKEIIIRDNEANFFIFETWKVESFFDDNVPFFYQEGNEIYEKDISGYLAGDETDEYSLLDFLVNVDELLRLQ